jgi:hypothetical protein
MVWNSNYNYVSKNDRVDNEVAARIAEALHLREPEKANSVYDDGSARARNAHPTNQTTESYEISLQISSDRERKSFVHAQYGSTQSVFSRCAINEGKEKVK